MIARHQGVRLTYGELKAAVGRLAAGLVSLGLEKGDRIGIWSPNSEWVLTQFRHRQGRAHPGQHQPAYRTAIRRGVSSAEPKAL